MGCVDFDGPLAIAHNYRDITGAKSTVRIFWLQQIIQGRF